MAETFWKIIRNSKIEIPEIQRDYAQGRISDRVNTIREGFVSDLLDAINSGNSLNLDFIFGQSVDRTNQANFNKNKQSLEQMLQVLKKYSKDTGVDFKSKVSPKPVTVSEDRLLIPFDGQQRLTTLFLLHLYIGVMAEKDISVLANFNYKTRESSTQFIKKIIENTAVILHFNSDKEIKFLSDAIKNQSWFFSSWEKDPTVAGMLVMLDEIRKQVIDKKIDVEKAWNNLVEREYVSFDFFDIQEEGFDEDLYVKMNARGKGLTDFENFRAWLEKKHKESLTEYDWVSKIDKDWLDLFWGTKKEVKDVDVNFLAFFKNMALLIKLRIPNSESDKNYSLEKQIIEILKPKSYTPTSKYEKENVFNENSLEYIFKILDVLASDKKVKKIDDVVDEIWTKTFRGGIKKGFTELLLVGFDGLTLYHKTFFFSILKFLELREGTNIEKYSKEDWDNFKDWLRISRNLIYNSRIDDSSAYIPAILAIDNLGEKILSIKSTISQIPQEGNKKEKWISFFNGAQQKEECEKIALLTNNDNYLQWSKLINEAEKHYYFYGQIDFIFKLSNNDLPDFERYFNKLSFLFSEKNVSSKEYILQCLFFAFDAKGTWLEVKGSTKKFYKSSALTSRDRDENWRHLFNDPEKRKVLKSFLDSNKCTATSINVFIEEQKQKITDWRKLILETPEVLKVCDHGFLEMKDKFDIRLLSKTRTTSKQRELRSYYFYLRQDKENVKPFKGLHDYSTAKQNETPCAVYHNWEYKKDAVYFMDCLYKETGYALRFWKKPEGEIMDIEIKNPLIDKCGFQKIDNGLILDSMTYEELLEKLKTILNFLSDLEDKSKSDLTRK